MLKLFQNPADSQAASVEAKQRLQFVDGRKMLFSDSNNNPLRGRLLPDLKGQGLAWQVAAG